MKWILKLAAILLLSGAAFSQGTGTGGTGGGSVRVTGTPAANDCAKFVNSNTITTSGGACGGGGGSGTVTSVGLVGTASQITVTGTSPITTSGSFTLSLPASLALGTDNATAGTLQLSNGSAAAHTIWSSGATTTNTIQGFAAVPTTGHLLDCTVTSTTCLLHDSGVVTANVVNASAPGAGIAHFAGSTQTVTSSAVSLSADVTGQLPIGSVGSSGLSGTSPVTISAAGAIACATCIVATVNPGVGILHVAGSTQTATSSAVDLSGADATGTMAAGRMPALTGDVTNSAGSLTTALGNIPNAVTMAGDIVATNSAAPSSPASGKDSIFTDSTDLRFHDKNASGVIGTTVVADTGASNNFLTAISAAGAISKAQPAFTNISGSVAAGQMPALTGDATTSAGAVAVSLAAPFKKRACEIVWGGTGTANILVSGDDSIANNSCFNKLGVTETITAVYCMSDIASNTVTVNPVFGTSGSGTTILSGALTCGSSNAYSSTGTVSNGALTDGSGINPVMGGTLNAHSIHLLIIYTVPNS